MPEVPEAGAVQAKPRRMRRRSAATTVDTMRLKRIYDEQKSDRSPVEQCWRDIETFFAPLGSGSQPAVNMTEGAVPWKRPDIYDSTGIDAANKLAASIHMDVTGPAIRWFKLAWRDKDLRKDAEANTWLDQVGDIVFETLKDSDFQTEIAAADHDLVTFGHMFVVEEPASCDATWKGVDFEAVPVRECYFLPDSLGGIAIFFRRLYWTALQVDDLCERRGWDTPQFFLDAIKDGKNLTQAYEIVFAVWEREDAETSAGKHPLAPSLRPYGCVYFRADNGERIGEEGGYYDMPVHGAPWDKTAGSKWGHGPAHIQLANCKSLNAWAETEQQAAAKQVDPSWGVTERGLMSDLNQEPGGITVARSKDDIWILESGAKFDQSERTKAELREMIERGFHSHELILKSSPAMTATEVQARYEIMLRILGSTLARIESGVLSPIVLCTLSMLYRAGQLPRMPQNVAKLFAAGKADFNIEYQGPLSRSQRTDEVAAIERGLAGAAATIKMGLPLQLVQAIIDIPEALREMFRLLGTPARLLKPDAEAKKVWDALVSAQQKAEAAQTAQVSGQARKAHAEAASIERGGPGAPAPAGAADLSGLPVSAQPSPIVSPSFQPVQPFAQPGPAEAAP